MKKYFVFVIIFCSLASIAHASAVSRFMFVTSPQIVAPNILSKPITVQSQDSMGVMVQTLETYDVFFVSSSATGEFVTSAGKKISTTTTMSKGTGNRTVYYEDSSIGNFLLTVTAKARTSKQTFTDAQRIIVADSAHVAPVTKIVNTVLVPVPQKTLPESTAQVSATSTSVSQTAASEQGSRDQTANVSQSQVVFSAPPQTDFLHRIFAWPIRITDSIYRFFFGE